MILIKNCTLISMDPLRKQIEYDVDILVNKEKIEKIGQQIKVTPDMKVIDGSDKIVLPGFINCHAHLPMSLFRETIDGYALQDWLNQVVWPKEAKLKEQDIYQGTLLTCTEMIRSGTTFVNDHYFFPDVILKALETMHMQAIETNTLMDIHDQGEKNWLDFFTLYQTKKETVPLSLAPHSLYTCSEAYIQQIIPFAREHRLMVHMHFCENEQEVATIKQEYHVAHPSDVLKRYFEGTRLVLAHAVKVDDYDLGVLKEMDATVVHCPVSNLKLGCGIAPIQKMLAMGINVALGTDGQGSGSNMDLFEVMKLTALLQKGVLEDATVLPAYEVLKMATLNGAKALGLAHQTGSITEGKNADLIILDLNQPFTIPVHDLVADIVYNANRTNVITVISKGTILMENQKLCVGNKLKIKIEKKEE